MRNGLLLYAHYVLPLLRLSLTLLLQTGNQAKTSNIGKLTTHSVQSEFLNTYKKLDFLQITT